MLDDPSVRDEDGLEDLRLHTPRVAALPRRRRQLARHRVHVALALLGSLVGRGAARAGGGGAHVEREPRGEEVGVDGGSGLPLEHPRRLPHRHQRRVAMRVVLVQPLESCAGFASQRLVRLVCDRHERGDELVAAVEVVRLVEEGAQPSHRRRAVRLEPRLQPPSQHPHAALVRGQQLLLVGTKQLNLLGDLHLELLVGRRTNAVGGDQIAQHGHHAQEREPLNRG